MSLDNVIAVAGAADGDMLLVTFGIVVSIPIIVWGSKLVLMLMDRFPAIITFGGGLLGWIGGKMLVTDVALAGLMEHLPHWTHYLFAAAGALFVIGVGTRLARRAAPGPLEEVAGGRHGTDTNPDG
jgi:predicted tellurium resistance membrane protein TerC